MLAATPGADCRVHSPALAARARLPCGLAGTVATGWQQLAEASELLDALETSLEQLRAAPLLAELVMRRPQLPEAALHQVRR